VTSDAAAGSSTLSRRAWADCRPSVCAQAGFLHRGQGRSQPPHDRAVRPKRSQPCPPRPSFPRRSSSSSSSSSSEGGPPSDADGPMMTVIAMAQRLFCPRSHSRQHTTLLTALHTCCVPTRYLARLTGAWCGRAAITSRTGCSKASTSRFRSGACACMGAARIALYPPPPARPLRAVHFLLPGLDRCARRPCGGCSQRVRSLGGTGLAASQTAPTHGKPSMKCLS
jgi:hypothetical protein